MGQQWGIGGTSTAGGTEICTGVRGVQAYPRKIGKGEAYKKYQTRRKDGYSDAELLEAAKNYAIDCRRRKTEKEYIKHPKTFLSDSLPFLDYLPKREKPQEDPGAAKTNPFEEWGEDT